MSLCSKCGNKTIAKGLCQKHYDETRKEKRRVSSLAYYHANKESILPTRKEYQAQYRTEHREELRASQAEYRARPENRKKANETTRAWYRANIEQARLDGSARALAWAKRHPEEAKARVRVWDKAHPEERKARAHTRRARLKGAEGSHTAKQVKELFARQNGKCAICQCDLDAGYHKDHVMPLALGGSNWISNIQLTCPSCNHSKGAKHPDEFLQERGLA